VSTTLEALFPRTANTTPESNPCFVHQCSRLQGVVGPFPRHLGAREIPELRIDMRKQYAGGVGFASVHRLEEERDVGHARTLTLRYGANEAKLVITPYAGYP